MKRKLIGAVLLAIGLVAAWRASLDFEDQTRLILEICVTIVCGGIGARLLFPRARW